MNGCDWGQAWLLDRASWDARRRAYHVGGISLPPADWVLCLGNSPLFDVINRPREKSSLMSNLQAHLHTRGLRLDLLTPSYAALRKVDRRRPSV